MHAHNYKKKEMELLFNIITLLSILLSSLLPLCASFPIQMQQTILQNQEEVNDVHQKFPLPMVPRKLRFTEKVKEYAEARDLASQKQKDYSLAGKQEQRKENMVLGSKGTRQEWMEREDDPSQYFTMDYTRVRKRRPIHNKQFPLGP